MEQALAQPNKHGRFERLACANVCNQSLQLLLSGAPRNEPRNERTVGLPQGSCALTHWVTRGEKIEGTTSFMVEQGTKSEMLAL